MKIENSLVLRGEELAEYKGDISEFGYANYGRTAKEFARMIEKGTAVFDNAVQRGLVWDTERKSHFIRNIICKMKTEPFFANMTKDESGTKIYDFVDGKQRGNTVAEFFADKFALSQNTPLIRMEGKKNGKDVYADISGLKFSQLPADFQHRLETYPFVIYYTDEATSEMIAEQFFGLNNGKPLSSIERIKVITKSAPQVYQVAEHPIMREIFTERSYKNGSFETALKGFAALMMDKPCFDKSEIEKFAVNQDISDDDVRDLEKAFTTLQEAHKLILTNLNPDGKNLKDLKADTKAVARKIYKRTNLLSLIQLALNVSVDGNVQMFAEFLFQFFNTADAGQMSNYAKYNDNSVSGVTHADKVANREASLFSVYKEFSAKWKE